jgi:hypothetical protein
VTVGAIAGVTVAAGLLLAGALPTPAELAQLLRESAWERARAGLPERSPWPWAETQSALTAQVPRLGLSASVVKDDQKPGMANDAPRPGAGEVVQNSTTLSEVAIGDRIIVTTASGASRVYRVTGRKIVDPHLAESGSGDLAGDATLVTCRPLDPASSLQLDIQATTIDPPAPKPGQEHKL